MLWNLGQRAGILGNSITEMKVTGEKTYTFATNRCLRFSFILVYYVYERKSCTLPHICM